MKKKYFYSHLVELDSVIIELEKLNMSETEKVHLITLMHSSMHHIILDVILSELTEEDKKIFLENITADDHEKIWQHLNSKIEKIEEKIKRAADDLKKQLHEDIREIRK